MEAGRIEKAAQAEDEEPGQAGAPHDQDGGTAAEETEPVVRTDNVTHLVELEREQRRIAVDADSRRLYGVTLDELARGTPGVDYELPEEPA